MAARHVEGSAFERDVEISRRDRRGEICVLPRFGKRKGIGGASSQDLRAQPIRRVRPALPIHRLMPMSPRGESCDEVFELLYEEYMRSRFVGWRFMNHAQRDALEIAVLAEDAAAAERERALAESLRKLRSLVAERERQRRRAIMHVFSCERASEVSGDASAVQTEDEG